MRILFFLISALVTIAFVSLCWVNNPAGAPLPSVGALFDPFGGFWQNAEAVKNYPDDQLDIPGLENPVKVIFDDRMAPHIFAESITDAYFVQGYITAKYRLWQMDIATRAVSGRLSEILGPVTLERDKLQRKKGMVMAAENSLAAWSESPTELAQINAYCDGVNAYIQKLKPKDYPIEFKLLSYQPEPWTLLKSALFFKSMAETLCFRSEDLPSSNVLALLGREQFDFLYPEYFAEQSPVIPTSVKWDFDPVPLDESGGPPAMIGEVLPYPAIPQSPKHIGSNNWAVSGSKTANGYPILCNDPHLRLSLPSIWFEIQIHTPELNAYGVSLPGLPGIVIGFNEHIAWGETNVGQDVLDWYKITWLNEEKTRYLLDDQPREVSIREEVIQVKGQDEAIVEKVKYTVWGPIVYEDPESRYRDLAMRWIAHDRPEQREFYELGTFTRLMAAKNYEDYRLALKGYDSPAQNFVFAAKDGDIAITVNGKLPVKKPGQGRFLQDGSFSGSAWRGFIPREQIPQVRNPERGFVSSANQHSTGPDYPYYYNGGFDEYRGRLINRILSTSDSLTIEDMMALQNLNQTLLVEEGLPALLNRLDKSRLDTAELQLLDVLANWNGEFGASAYAPVLFEEWRRKAFFLTFDELDLIRDSIAVTFPETWRFIKLLTQDSAAAVFDVAATPEKETSTDVVTMAFREIAALQNGGTPWADYKATNIAHLGLIDAFSRRVVPVGGYREAPNALTGTNGPSWRMIVELGPEIKAYGIYPGGQSGNPGSPFYENMIDQWVAGEYHSLLFLKAPEAPEGKTKFILELN